MMKQQNTADIWEHDQGPWRETELQTTETQSYCRLNTQRLLKNKFISCLATLGGSPWVACLEVGWAQLRREGQTRAWLSTTKLVMEMYMEAAKGSSG